MKGLCVFVPDYYATIRIGSKWVKPQVEAQKSLVLRSKELASRSDRSLPRITKGKKAFNVKLGDGQGRYEKCTHMSL